MPLIVQEILKLDVLRREVVGTWIDIETFPNDLTRCFNSYNLYPHNNKECGSIYIDSSALLDHLNW
jgi:hypothetical protein